MEAEPSYSLLSSIHGVLAERRVKKVESAPNPVLIANLKNVLESQGIRCEVRGEPRGAAVGELPPGECWPELWVLNDGDEERARALLRERAADAEGPAWTCPGCQEEVEPQFAVCWSCGAEKPTPAVDEEGGDGSGTRSHRDEGRGSRTRPEPGS